MGPNKRMAELALKDVEVRIAKKQFLGVVDDKRISFVDFSKEYLEYAKVNKAPTSYKRNVVSMKKLVKAFGDYYLNEITPPDIEKYKAQRRSHVAPATVNRELECLSHMFTMAVS